MTDHLRQRQNVLRAPVREIEDRLDAVAQAFGETWLEGSGTLPLQQLWKRHDALATNQLVWFGDAIIGMRVMDARWTDGELSKVKSGDVSNRKGAEFELLGLNIFAKRHRVVPAVGSNPGYDGTLEFTDAARLALSLKNYGRSTHEQAVQEKGAKLETAFLKAMMETSRNGIDLRIIATHYPSDADWDRLIASLPNIMASNPGIPGHAARDGIWTVMMQPLSGFEPRTAPSLSYQVIVLTPLHKNERQNLISKLDEAYANAQKHAKQDSDLCRGVLIHLPENASVKSCESWAREYFADRPDGLVDLVLLYQTNVVALSQDTSGIGHSMTAVPGPRYSAWQTPARGKRRGPIGDFYVGTILAQPAGLQLQIRAGCCQWITSTSSRAATTSSVTTSFRMVATTWKPEVHLRVC